MIDQVNGILLNKKDSYAIIMVGGMGFDSGMAGHVEILLMGMLIIFFLIVEPHGLARLWQIAKEKLRLWPFPH